MTLQHIQSILETNVRNVRVKIAVILSKIIFLCAKKSHANLQYASNICAKFQTECLKTLRGVDYTILLPLVKTNLKIVLVKNPFLACKRSHTYLQYAYNICAKFQINCLKTLGGVDYTNLLPHIED